MNCRPNLSFMLYTRTPNSSFILILLGSENHLGGESGYNINFEIKCNRTAHQTRLSSHSAKFVVEACSTKRFSATLINSKNTNDTNEFGERQFVKPIYRKRLGENYKVKVSHGKNLRLNNTPPNWAAWAEGRKSHNFHPLIGESRSIQYNVSMSKKGKAWAHAKHAIRALQKASVH